MESKHNQKTRTEPDTLEFSFLAVIPDIWAKRKSIAIFVTGATIASIVYVLLVPSMYTAETSILPELDKGKILGLGGMADLAAVTGLNVGDAPVSKLYPMIIKSARVLREVIYAHYSMDNKGDSTDLISLWKTKGESEEEKLERALRTLRERMSVTFDNRLGTLVLTVEMEGPKLAADVANNITRELDLYTRTKRRTNVTAQREFIEQRLQEVEQSLKTAENILRSFREKNRRVTDSPQLLLEQGRLEREVLINSTIFIELKKQIEVAKIEEIKNIPLINVLDPAREPIERSSPKRRQTVVIVFVFSLLLAAGLIVARRLPMMDALKRNLQVLKLR
jgi:uncharacterized protein involved in exopolysaccharide biosynthesis